MIEPLRRKTDSNKYDGVGGRTKRHNNSQPPVDSVLSGTHSFPHPPPSATAHPSESRLPTRSRRQRQQQEWTTAAAAIGAGSNDSTVDTRTHPHPALALVRARLLAPLLLLEERYVLRRPLVVRAHHPLALLHVAGRLEAVRTAGLRAAQALSYVVAAGTRQYRLSLQRVVGNGTGSLLREDENSKYRMMVNTENESWLGFVEGEKMSKTTLHHPFGGGFGAETSLTKSGEHNHG